MPTELWILFALVAWVAVLLPIAAWVDRRRSLEEGDPNGTAG